MGFRWWRAAMLACALLRAATTAADPVAAPGAAAYFAPPRMSTPELSPNGRWVAARAIVAGTPRLALFDTWSGTFLPRPVALAEDERLEWHHWAGADRLIASLVLDGPVPRMRLVSIDAATGAVTALGRARPARRAEVIHIDTAGAFMLLETGGDGDIGPAVERVDLTSGAVTEVIAPRAHVWEWVADAQGVVRAGVGDKEGRGWILYRSGERDRFAESRERGDAERLAAVPGSDMGYALAQAPSGRMALFGYDFRRGRLGALLHEDVRGDLTGFHIDDRGKLAGIEVLAEREEIRWLDADYGRRQKLIDGALPGRINRVLTASSDKSRLLVHSRSASDAGAYYLFADGRPALLATINPDVGGAEMRPVAFAARDGLSIPAYLTLPGGRPAKGLALIVLAHGGPFARDDWSYDPWVQYLAARGYAVLQPNFRGSTGFGRAFEARGNGEWGRGMQNDLDDAAAWAAAQGIADPKRVCIMGASFGGYAAMWAAAQNSPAYRCAISFAGIADVQAQLEYDRQTFEEGAFRAWRRRIQGKAASLDSLSPLKRAADFRMPILIGHGTEDETVPAEQSAVLHDALLRAGRPHDYVVYPGEGHNLEDPDNNADFLDRVGKFLDAHNPS